MRKDGRLFAILPPDVDPLRRAHYGPGGRRAFADKAEAEAWLAVEIARRRNPLPGAAHGDEELGSYLTRYLKTYGTAMSPRTLSANRVALRYWLPYLGRVRLRQVTHEVIQGAVAQLREARWRYRRKAGTPAGLPRPYSPATLAHARQALAHALSYLVPDVLPHNPVRRTVLARHQPPPRPCWDAGEADRFLAAAERRVPQLALAYRLILRRGIRRGEVLSLLWSDVETQRGVLVVAQTAGTRAGEAGPTKGRRTRDIPLGDDLPQRFATHRARQARPGRWVFTNPATGKPYGINILTWHLDTLTAEAGVPRIAPKDMRASCATILLDEGVALPRVSELLGHADVATTSRFYARQIKQRAERVTRVADALDAAHARALTATRQRAPTPLRGAES